MEQTITSISTYGGDFFDLLHPENNTYDIEVIAHALSYLCRYTGHVSRFYSVAEHSVLVSRACSPRWALEGLLHDASEAFVGDVSSPLKKLLPNYKVIEEGIQEQICKTFNLQYPFPHDIHLADKRLYWAERQEIAPGKDKMWHQELGASRKVTPQGWSPRDAKEIFLERYKELTDGRNGQSLGQGEETAATPVA